MKILTQAQRYQIEAFINKRIDKLFNEPNQKNQKNGFIDEAQKKQRQTPQSSVIINGI